MASESIRSPHFLNLLKIPFELHIYQNGLHGVGLADGKIGAPDLPDVADWSERLATWLQAR